MPTDSEYFERKNRYKIVLYKNAEKKDRFDIVKGIVDNAINYALPSKLPKTSALFFKNNSKAGYTLLHFTAQKLDLESTEYLLDHGADFMKQGSHNGNTPLHEASISFMKEFHSGKIKYFDKMRNADNTENHSKAREVVNLILSAQIKSGNASNPRGKHGISHFHVACAFNNVEAVEFFLDADVSIDQAVNMDSKYFFGCTPLHFAAGWYSFEAAQLLLIYEANLRILDAKNMSPLHLLIDRYMKMMDSITMGRPFYCAHLREDMKEINRMMVLFLVEGKFSDPNFVDHWGLTSLHITATLQDSNIIEELLKSQADIGAAVKADSPLWPGYTALHFAAHFNVETMKLLMKRGANLLAEDTKNQRPLDVCLRRCKATDIHSILLLSPTFKDILLSDGSTRLLDMIAAMQSPSSLNDFLQNLENVDVFIPIDCPLWPGYTLLHLALMMITYGNNIRGDDDNSLFDHNYVFDEEDADSLNCSKEDAAMYLKRIQLCLEKGCKTITPDLKGSTPVHIAFDFREEKLVKMFFDSSRNFLKDNHADSSGNLSLLHIACIVNDRLSVEKLLNNGADINIPVMKKLSWPKRNDELETYFSIQLRVHSTPLHLAVIFENREIVELLLENGADIYAKDALGFTPIHLAMTSDVLDKTIALRLLSTENLRESMTDEGLSHLHVAAYANDTNAMKKLLKCEDVNVNSKINFGVYAPPFTERFVSHINTKKWPTEYSSLAQFTGLTPLHLAVRYGSIDVAKILLAENADIFLQDKYGLSCIYYIVCISKIYRENASLMKEFAQVLKSRDFDTSALDDSGLTMLHVACGLFDEELARDLLKRGAVVNALISEDNATRWKYCTPLHILMLRDQEDYTVNPSEFTSMVQLILDHGADVTISEDFTPILAYFTNVRVDRNPSYMQEAADLLLRSQKSYDINPSFHYQSHFHFACTRNAVDVVKQFLECGVDVNDTFTYDKQLPLHAAVAHGSEEVVHLLIEYGADIMAKDIERNTVLHYAIKGRRRENSLSLIKFLLSAGVKINAVNFAYETAWDLLMDTDLIPMDLVKVFLQNGAKIDFVNLSSFSEDHWHGILGTALTMDPEDREWIFKSVLDTYNTSDLDDGGCNAIHSVVLFRKVINISIKDFTAMLEKLIQGGCDLNQQNVHGHTPLHLAKSRIATSALLKFGADVNIADTDGRPPFIEKKCIFYEFNIKPRHKELFDHTSKMVIAGMTLHKEIREARKILISRKIYEVDEELEKRYEAELEKMESTQISRFLTMRHFLYESGGAVAEYPLLSESRRKSIDEFFHSREKIFEIFPEYGGLILCQHRKAVARVNLIEPAIYALFILIRCNVPDLCLHVILKFLNNDELSLLIKTQSGNVPDSD